MAVISPYGLVLSTPLQNDIQEMPLICAILELYNPRIIEILRLRKKDIFQNKFVVLPGAKKSSSVVIRDRELVARIVKLSLERTDVIFIHSPYTKIYRFVRNNYSHLSDKIKINKNRKITHAFRYLAVANILDDNIIKPLLHHGSKKSNKFYINKMKGSDHGNNS